MIDEELTFEKYGYYSTELKPQSNKHVVAVCNDCGAIRYPKKQSYRDLCQPCSTRTDEHRRKVSEATTGKNNPFYGKNHSKESRKKISDAHNGMICSDKTIIKMSDSHKGEKHWNYGRQTSYESRKKSSATQQGIPYDEWTGFVANGEYCERFDESCRERIRAKYDYKCFVCDLSQDKNITKNGKQIKLSVHHVDKNKNQGCDGVLWELIPLCMHCHPGAHHDPIKSRLKYLLNVKDV